MTATLEIAPCPADIHLVRSLEILDKAAILYARSKVAYRDALLEVGNLLHEYVLARLAEGDGMGESDRREIGAMRRMATEKAATKLRVNRSRINDLIRVSATARLLAPVDGFGELGYTALRWFRVCIDRPRGRLRRCKGGFGLDASAKEEWQIRKGLGGIDPCTLLQEAVTNNWDSRDVRAALVQAGLLYQSGRGRRQGDGTYPVKNRAHSPGSNPGAIGRTGTIKDVAEFLLGILREAPDPEAILQEVERGLVKKPKRLTL